MITCDAARELFSARLDEALTDAERAELDAHLAGCGDCPRELARFEQTVRLLRTVPPLRAPVGFVDRVVAAARPTPWYARWRARLSRPLAWGRPVEATVLILVGVTSAYLYERSPELRYGAAPVPSYPVPATAGRAPASPAPPPAAPAPAVPAPAVRQLAKDELTERAVASRTAASPPAGAAGAAAPAQEPTSNVATPPAASALSVTPPAKERAAELAAPPPTSAPSATPLVREKTAEVAPPRPAPSAPAPAASGAPAPTAKAPAASAEMDQGQQGGQREEPSQRARADSKLAAPAAKALRSADVLGRLAVGDRARAEQALATLLARLGATEIGRRAEGGVLVVEIAVAAAAYPELIDGLELVGRGVAEAPAAELPARVRLVVRITD
jgi:hypothetical protein